MLTVGPRLHLERIRRGVSQAELSRRTGIAQANLSNIENGKQDITVSTLLQICLALDIKPSSVLDPPVRDQQNSPFTRARLERIAASIVEPRRLSSKEDRKIADLLGKNMLPGHNRRTSSKQAAVDWADLRRRLTDDEIATLRQRVEDALQRQTHEKKHR